VTVTIAPAGPADVQPLATIAGPHRRDEIADAVQTGRCLMARRDGAIAGFAVIGVPFFGNPFIDLLFVVEPHRRTGVGRALIRHLSAAHAGRKLFTSTNRSNTPMQALLASEGFVKSGMVDNLDPGDPELFYCRLP
jgi:GNAT superfamily N-acetyltransferase